MPGALCALAAADALLTAWGLRLGYITEANPLMASLFSACPAAAVGICISVTTLAAAALHAARRKHPWTAAALRWLVVVRVGIIGLHLRWLACI